MIRVANEVGRLLEAEFVPPFTQDEVTQFIAETKRLLLAASKPVVIFAEMRKVSVLPAEMADGIIALMRSGNPRVEKNGVLLGATAVFTLQAQRIFREAGHPGRRGYSDPKELREWLSETLDDKEKARLALKCK